MNLFSKRNVLQRLFPLFLCIVAGFLIFDQNGYLAIEDSSDGAVYPTEFRTQQLPPSDRALLREGIWCETPSDAARVLENFNS